LLQAGLPAVLAGDYNVAPTDLDIDPTRSWADDALVQPASRKAFASLISDGWCDALRASSGDARTYTFWHYMRNRFARDAGLRLDHLLLSPSLVPRLGKTGVDRTVRGLANASDHAPVWIELAPTGPARARKGRR